MMRSTAAERPFWASIVPVSETIRTQNVEWDDSDPEAGGAWRGGGWESAILGAATFRQEIDAP